MVSSLEAFASSFPLLASLSTTQSLYGLPSIPGCSGGLPCSNYLLTISDSSARPEDAAYYPDAFFSGEVHGDETVGPLATYHAAELLLTAADCAVGHFGNFSDPERPSCEAWFGEWGYGEAELHWLSRLASTRRTLISPMSNPQGFDKVRRAENNLDPNRDFAYDVASPSKCMRTVTARHINEVYRASLVQVGITFHGGMTCVAYEWGAPSHNAHGTYSPDNAAQKMLGASLSDVGGTFSSEFKYPSAPMNEIV
jgi:hypothetical protein